MTPTSITGAWLAPRTARSEVQFVRSHLALGFFILIGEAAAAMAYSAMTRGAHREALSGIALMVVILGIVGLTASTWISAQPWRNHFVLLSLVASAGSMAVCASLDGGLESPFLLLTVLPIMYSALLLCPAAVALCAGTTLAAAVAVGLSDPDIEVPQESLVMLSAIVLGTGILAVMSSLYRARLDSSKAALAGRLEHLGTIDALTGCSNQRTFYDRLRGEVLRALDRQQPLSLLVTDVDLFKAYNDTHGREDGDNALIVVGERLGRTVRQGDVVGRIGGDEFGVLLPETDLKSAIELANRIVESRRSGEPSLSVGVAELSTGTPTASSLFQAADRAMYEAKAQGRDRVGGEPPVNDHPGPRWEEAANGRRADETVRQERRQRIETETILGLVLDEGPVGFAFIDRDFRLIRANRTLIELSGSAPEKCLGRHVADLVPHLWPHLETQFHRVLEEGLAVRNLEFRAPGPDGLDRATQLGSFFPVVLEETPIGIGVMVVDISDRKHLEESQEMLTEAVVETLAAAAEARDPYTAGHQRRVAHIAEKIAGAMGCDPWTVRGIALAAAIHDIGKIAIPAEILSRPGRLSDSEMALVRCHVRSGYDMVRNVEFPWPVADMILQHHERLDGSGYPQALQGDQISLGGRIIAVADVVEAMSAHRPYRPALGLEVALAHLIEGKEKLFDPQIVDLCVGLFRRGELSLEDGPARGPVSP